MGGKLNALYLRHDEQVNEMKHRGYNHQSPLEIKKATGKSKQDEYIDKPSKQIKILKQKGCNCKI